MKEILERKYVGLLGGSFDPPHDGHVLISDVALKHGLNGVAWLITEQNPLKKKPD